MAYYNPYLLSDLNRLERIQRLDMPVDVSQLTGYDIPLVMGKPLGAQPTNLPTQARGLDGNVYSQALMGGLQLASDVSTIANQPLGLGQAPAPMYMEGFDPTYQTGDYAARAFGATPQGASAGEILGTAGKTAATGASIGTTIGGPVGTLIGAGVGAVAGALSAGIGGGVRKRRQTRERERALSQIQSQQEQFNRAQAAFNEQQAAQFGYQQRRNRRMQNLFI